jgi:monoamine oxidase
MPQKRVLVIGGGAAGLTAAEILSGAGLKVTLLEGLDRLGGRMFTVRSKVGDLPIELGAEFLHGEKIDTWNYIRQAGLKTHEVPDRHLRETNGQLKENPKFWEELEKVFAQASNAKRDKDILSFIGKQKKVSAAARKLAIQFVEGFHAAPANRMSVKALARAEEASERDNADRQFRITNGYSALTDWFAQRLKSNGVAVSLNCVVKTVRWCQGRVEVLTQTPTGPRRFEAAAALITLPLGVLQETGPRAVVFDPPLREKHPAIEGLAVGNVYKVVLQFRSPWWPMDNFGFIHASDGAIPTWWSDERGPLLTGWAGGPRAEQLGHEEPDIVLAQAIETLRRLFNARRGKIEDTLIEMYCHSWRNDPMARGAYSYTPVGMATMPKLLAAPLAGTLFFAGEATDSEGEQGTVHGAIASGKRAATEVLAKNKSKEKR